MTRRGVTLMELVIVAALMGIIAAFAIPNFGGARDKAHERDIIEQLTMLHSVQGIYRARNGEYLDSSSTSEEAIDFLNLNLDILMLSNGNTYSYESDGTTYWAQGAYKGYAVRVTQEGLDSGNPCCHSGTCPTLSAC